MTIVLNGTTGITNDGGYTGDGVSFADTTPANTLVTTTGGNVGIGTNSPTEKLQVEGNIYLGTTSRAIFTAGTADLVLQVNTGNTIFSRSNGSAESMRIDSSGNLIVGATATPGVQGIGIKIATNPGNPMVFYNSSSVLAGYINVSGTTTAYITSSDYRLKENVEPMTGALATVSALKPVTYTWKADGKNGQGFIAHELAEVVPDCVTGEKDQTFEDGSINPQGIDTSFLVATLTAAIQEQTAIITDLKSRIETLEAK